MQDLNTFLKKLGFSDRQRDPVYGHHNVFYWYRSARGAQIVVRMWPATDFKYHEMKPSFEVETTFESEDGPWMTIKYYGISFEELKEKLVQLGAKLLKARRTVGVKLRTDGSCCHNEQRTFEGGCANCGDPAY